MYLRQNRPILLLAFGLNTVPPRTLQLVDRAPSFVETKIALSLFLRDTITVVVHVNQHL